MGTGWYRLVPVGACKGPTGLLKHWDSSGIRGISKVSCHVNESWPHFFSTSLEGRCDLVILRLTICKSSLNTKYFCIVILLSHIYALSHLLCGGSATFTPVSVERFFLMNHPFQIRPCCLGMCRISEMVQN